jgi:hypothetical protein
VSIHITGEAGQGWNTPMAKQVRSGGTSRIRFVMVDAEIAEGEVSSITQAIQNALRGPTPAQIQRLPSPKAQEMNGSAAVSDAEPLTDEEEIVLEEHGETSSRPKGPRKPAPTPKVLQLDLTTELSLATFAGKANPSSDRKRYLVVAAWFKEHRATDAISASHVYTCYRALKWPTTISDFAQPLRQLKHVQLFEQAGKGLYSINHLGLAEVDKLVKEGE